MTEVLAGFLGGFLALAGGALVQMLGARAARRDRIGRLASEFLTKGGFAMEDLSEWRRSSDPMDPPRALADVRFMPESIHAGTELGLIGGRRLALAANAVAGHMNHLTLLATPGVPTEIWREAVIDFGAARLHFSQEVRRELGRPAMTDDELGHDAPDIDNPANTHTPL